MPEPVKLHDKKTSRLRRLAMAEREAYLLRIWRAAPIDILPGYELCLGSPRCPRCGGKMERSLPPSVPPVPSVGLGRVWWACRSCAGACARAK